MTHNLQTIRHLCKPNNLYKFTLYIINAREIIFISLLTRKKCKKSY